jgi:hypothetical protein
MVENGQDARQTQTDGTGILVGHGPEVGFAAAEEFTLGFQLAMDLKADDRLKTGEEAVKSVVGTFLFR